MCHSAALVPTRTLRSSTVPCIGAEPTWGASEATGLPLSGLGEPWGWRRQPTQTHGSSRTPRVRGHTDCVCVVTLRLCLKERSGRGRGVRGLLCHDALSPHPTEPQVSRAPSSDEEAVEEPQSRRTRMSLGTKGLKVSLFPGLSPSALKVASSRRPACLLSVPLASVLPCCPAVLGLDPVQCARGWKDGRDVSCSGVLGLWVSLGRDGFGRPGGGRAGWAAQSGLLSGPAPDRAQHLLCGGSAQVVAGQPGSGLCRPGRAWCSWVSLHACYLLLSGLSRRPSCAPGTDRPRRQSRQRASPAQRRLLSSAPSPARSRGWGGPSRCPPSQRSPRGR